MSRVRIEIYPDDEDFNNVQCAEVQGDPDVREAFDRAVAMARAALPPEKPLTLGAGTYTLEMKNVQLNRVDPELFFGQAEAAQGFDVKVVSDEPLRKPCEAPCPDEECDDRCARPLGHEGGHSTADDECTWDRRTFQNKPEEQCRMVCDKTNPDCWANCQRPRGHDGDCSCALAHDEGNYAEGED